MLEPRIPRSLDVGVCQPTAIYTNEPIPPNAITIIEIEDINNNETSTHDK